MSIGQWIGFLLALAGAQDAELYVDTAERTRQWIAFRSNTSPGNLDPATGTLTVEYGQESFDEGETRALLESPVGTRLSPSAGFPATYDVDLTPTFGKAKLEPGLHLVCIERVESGWQLVFVRFEEALAAGWDGAAAIPGAGVVVAARVEERRDGSSTAAHRVWTGPGADDRGLTFRVQYGPLSLQSDLVVKAKKGQPAAGETKRFRSTLRLGQGGAVLASVEHGLSAWEAGSGQTPDRLKPGKRWPLGKDHWTTLLVFAPLDLGGVRALPGDYSLLLERSRGEDAWALALIGSAACRKAFTNMHHAEKLDALVSAPMTREEAVVAADELDCHFDGREPARLVLHYGSDRWSVSVARAQ